MRKKLLVFHPALAPYRVEWFNQIALYFELKVVFFDRNLRDNKFDQEHLRSQLQCEFSFLLNGFNFFRRRWRRGVLKEIRNFRPDIIICYEYSPITLFLIFLKQIGVINGAIGSTIDDNLVIAKQPRSFLRALARRYSLQYLDYFILLSRDVAAYYKNSFGVDESRIIVYPILQSETKLLQATSDSLRYATDYYERFRLDGKIVILFVGRFVPEKGLLQFLHNVKELLKIRLDLALILVGDGVLKNEIHTFVEESRLQHVVSLPGRVEGSELYGYFLCSSGLILPSISETFGAVVNEALVFGLPVFCSSVAGAASLISSKNGVIFDVKNRENMFSRFVEFVNRLQPVQRSDLGTRTSLMNVKLQDFDKELQKLMD